MIRMTAKDRQFFDHVVEVMHDRMMEADGYEEEDFAAMAKLEQIAKTAPTTAVIDLAADRPTGDSRKMLRDVVAAEIDHWVPGASQRLIQRAACVLGEPLAWVIHHDDCGPEAGQHALISDWVAGLYVHRCAVCSHLFEI